MLPGIAPQPAVPQVPSSVFIGSQWNDTSLTSYTFSVDIGAAANNRVIVIAVGGNSTGTPTTVSGTIAGVAFTVLKDQISGTGYGAIIAAVVPASAGAGLQNVVINTATALQSCCVGAWRCLNIKSITPAATMSSVADPGTGTINVPAQGLLFATARCGVVAPTYTWVGVTQDFTQTNVGVTRAVSGGSYRATAAETGRTVTATRTAGGNAFILVAVSLR